MFFFITIMNFNFNKHMKSILESELQTELINFEQVQGKDFYSEIIDQGLLCDQKSWVRILREVRVLNSDFHTLRTYMAPVSDTIGILHFLMYPADGAMADKPLCGRVLIPKGYPTEPPVVHLLTITYRRNVDIFQGYAQKEYLKHMQSSMCFNILRSKRRGGIWQPDFTLSALISSLLQSIVSIKVPQEDGSDSYEYVTMETLSSIHQNIDKTFKENESFMPSQREIKKIEAIEVPTKYFEFPNSIWSSDYSEIVTVHSDPIYLQSSLERKRDNVYSIGFDLTELKGNANLVFALVLTNNPYDCMGYKSDTILIRNGVTATAAKKRAGRQPQWFYHGKPMNQEELKLIVTIGYDQYCISYLDGNKSIVHGDCPFSFLTPAEIGKVAGIKFYLTVFMKNKGGKPIRVNTYRPEVGYLHPAFQAQVEKEKQRQKEQEAQRDIERERKEKEQEREKEKENEKRRKGGKQEKEKEKVKSKEEEREKERESEEANNGKPKNTI